MKKKLKEKLKANKITGTIIKCVKCIKQNFLYYLPKKLAHKILYKLTMKKTLNLDNPKDLNEKIHYLIINEYGKREAELSDKIEVRNYIRKVGHDEILTKVYGVYKNFDEIDFDKLPDKFVLKTNHGSNATVICTNKENFDKARAKKILNGSLKQNFAKVALEYHYKYIKPMIMCEEYIDDGTGTNPIDYKMFCFGGKPECVLVCTGRTNVMKRDYYDLKWNYLEYAKREYRSDKIIDKPINFDKMIQLAKELSKPFDFVRVDFYNCKGKIFFGELTFSPAAGLNTTVQSKALEYLGNLIEL